MLRYSQPYSVGGSSDVDFLGEQCSNLQWWFHAEAGGHKPLRIVASPPNLAVLLTHCGQLILKKSVNLMPPDVRFKGPNAQNSISAGALPHTLLGELTALPRPIEGGTSISVFSQFGPRSFRSLGPK